MGSGDLNMKKSWHPVLLKNQQRVWEQEKKAHDEKKKLDQLRKEIEEERQLAELQRLQEESTGRKRVEKMDWMYATPSSGDGSGALGGARLDDKQMEDYLLGKKRVDDVLKQGEKNVGAASKDFIAVQNANTAQDIAAKIREDPLLAIKKQEQMAYQAMMNNPALRKLKKELKAKKEGTKEERKEKKRKEKEERRAARRDDDRPRRSGHFSDEEEDRYYRDRTRDSHRSSGRRDHDDDERPRTRSDSRSRSRSRSPPYRHRYNDHYSRAGDRRPRYEEGPIREGYSDRRYHESSRRDEPNGSRSERYSPEASAALDRSDRKPPAPLNKYGRPNALDLDERPTSLPRPATAPSGGPSKEELRAQRLAQMQADAEEHTTTRVTMLERRMREDEEQLKAEEEARKRLGKGDVKGAYVREQERLAFGTMGLGDMIGRRGGKGLIREEV